MKVDLLSHFRCNPHIPSLSMPCIYSKVHLSIPHTRPFVRARVLHTLPVPLPTTTSVVGRAPDYSSTLSKVLTYVDRAFAILAYGESLQAFVSRTLSIAPMEGAHPLSKGRAFIHSTNIYQVPSRNKTGNKMHKQTKS